MMVWIPGVLFRLFLSFADSFVVIIEGNKGLCCERRDAVTYMVACDGV
jgi:hypothetical protein